MLLLERLLRSNSGIIEQGRPAPSPLCHRTGSVAHGADRSRVEMNRNLAGRESGPRPARFRPLIGLCPVCSLLGSDGEG